MRDWHSYYRDLLATADMPVVGIGVTALNRIGPGYVLPGYEVICYKHGSDIDSLRNICPVRTVQKDFIDSGNITRNNTVSILKQLGVKDYLNSLGKSPSIFVYRSKENLDAYCKEQGWGLLANSHDKRDAYEMKEDFFKIGRSIGLSMIPGEQMNIADLDEDRLALLQKKYGKRLVFQITEIYRGGGQGTIFVENLEDFHHFHRFVDERNARWTKRRLERVNVTRYIDGESPSISGSATRHGVLSGVVQTQILDVEALLLSERDGVFVGHDWSYKDYSGSVQRQTDSIVAALGSYMWSRGYKGVFGVDLIVENITGKVYVVECNPRYTGAFPVYSMMQHQLGEVSFDTFQMLEFMGIDYEMDFDLINDSWKQPKNGSHLILHSPLKKDWARVSGSLVSGVYRLSSRGDLVYLREGATYEAMQSDDEFVLTDGCPSPGTVTKPRLRVGKLIFRRGSLHVQGELTDYVHRAVNQIMSAFSFDQVSEAEQARLNEEYNYTASVEAADHPLVDILESDSGVVELSNL